jgi:GntR family transcriptional regulator
MIYSSFTMLTITIDRGLDDPVYAQIARQVRQLIASGSLSPGMTLPSVRRLAGDLGVNLNTVARAYRMLEGEGFLLIRGRSGARVAAPAKDIQRSTHVRLVGEMRILLAKFRQAGVTSDELLDFVHRELIALGESGTETSNG